MGALMSRRVPLTSLAMRAATRVCTAAGNYNARQLRQLCSFVRVPSREETITCWK